MEERGREMGRVREGERERVRGGERGRNGKSEIRSEDESLK